LNVRGLQPDFILLTSPQGQLYLPVGRLRQIQKYAGATPRGQARLAQAQTFQKRKRGSRKSCSGWPRLLDIYGRRHHQGYAFAA